ncbi:tyrosyl-trna synthetase [Pseudohyphozyma bogoriensis]|nr:tyrosyl-trna synthetase [Pseudohyphozyma bogoriensis]
MTLRLLPRELLLHRSWTCATPSPSLLHSRRLLSSSARTQNVIQTLDERGLLQDLTSRSIRKHVETPTSIYLGVDPSAASLHLGNLLALIALLHFRLEGHDAVALVGGATGSIGDPSGRSTERNALSPEVLQHNVEGITKQVTTFFERGVAFAEERNRSRLTGASEGAEGRGGSVMVVNNLDWLGGLGLLEFLREAGKGARMSTMLSRDSVKSRLDSSSGLSFTEFSYQLLQAYDFLTLHRTHSCTIQLGGSDQMGNIQSGIEMVRRANLKEREEKEGEEGAYGVTIPLLTTSSGEKFGKSAGNAVWLDAGLTSPFELYQFFIKTSDDDVLKYLKLFTFIRVVELEGIMHDHKVDPSLRVAQKILAAEVTELVHGRAGLDQALAYTSICYSDKPLPSLDLPSIVTALDANGEVPSVLTRLSKGDVVGASLEKLLLASGVFGSKTQARRAIESGGIHVNGSKLPPKSHQWVLKDEDVLEGGLVVIKSGKTGHRVLLLE